MRWCCFLFWFIYRLSLACLAHFNWVTAIYVNCAYFVLWKSYDLLWFWMHLILCFCFKPLRTENYLIVWCNLIFGRITRYSNYTFKEIYNIEYAKLRQSKTEQELEKISELEVSDEDREGQKSNDDGAVDDENSGREIKQNELKHVNSRELKINCTEKLAAYERNEENSMGRVSLTTTLCSSVKSSQQYDNYTVAERPVPPPRFKKQKLKMREVRPSKHTMDLSIDEQQNSKSSTHMRELPRQLIGHFSMLNFCKNSKNLGSCTFCRKTKSALSNALEREKEISSGESEVGSQDGLTSRIRRYLTPVKDRNSSPNVENAVDILSPNFTNTYDLTSAKELKRREKRAQKALAKRLRDRRRDELAIITKFEANAIELLLQILRMITSFAILVGNIRKTFIPAQFMWLKPGRHAYDTPELMMLWRCTVFLDVLLFWINVIWAYCLQWHLCCRLGLLKFWTWAFLLMLSGGIFMLYPMSYVQDNLDVSWCRFKPNSTLERYQPQW